MKDKNRIKRQLYKRRVASVRGRVSGLGDRPRIAVFRSSKHLYAQAIDDTLGQTLASANDRKVKVKDKNTKAKEIGLLLGKRLLEKKISRAVFDKRHYQYHGLVKEIADGIRTAGIKM